MAENPQDPQDEGSESYAPESYEDGQTGNALGKGPAVAAPPGKTMMMAAVGVVLVGFVMYQLFFAEEEEAPPPPQKPPSAAPVAQAENPIQQMPLEPPEPPPPLEPPPVEPLPPLPPPPEPPQTEVEFPAQGPTNEQLVARRKSSLFVVQGESKPKIDAGGSDSLGGTALMDYEPGSDNDPYRSAFPRAKATHVGDLRKLILQGKIIHAVLETAIDSTFPGPLRGLVTRDVYAESGKDILIQKGSRLIGNYNADVVRGQARIFIIWNRMIRPDGVDIDLSSPAVDRLGRTGLEGFVDNRYFEIFSGAALTSVFTIGLAAAGQELTGAGDTTTTQNAQGTTQTGDPTAAAISEAVQTMGTTAERVLGGLIDMRPLITVDQGTPVNIFVNKDLEFPDEVTHRIRLLQ